MKRFFFSIASTFVALTQASGAFQFQKGDTVAIIGNGLADRMQHDGWTETLIQAGAPELELRFRNMSLTGDQVTKMPRSKGFTPMPKYLKEVGADVVVMMFGYNESFRTPPAKYGKDLEKLVNQLKGAKTADGEEARFVLCSPIAHEDLKDPNLPSGRANNPKLSEIRKATQAAAERVGATFVDLFEASAKLYYAHEKPLTLNGIHLNEFGNQVIGEVIAEALLGKKCQAELAHEKIREAVLDKNWHWHNRYRATDGNDVWGSRSGLTFVDGQTNAEVLQHELKMFDVMTANRDRVVWARAKGGDLKVDDSNVPKAIPVKSNVGGKSKSSSARKEGSLNYRGGEEVIADMVLPEGFEVNLFADEKKFPELANPVQLQVDGKGRIWAAAWGTYPKWEPMQKFNDSLLIFEDDDKDGKADRVKEFAKVHNPLGFEFWNGGVIVTSQPDILFLKDTDGDDVADVRHVLFQGIGSSDTHHAANNLIYGPDGGIYWQSGIFLHHNHETPWGPSLSTGASGMYRFDPRRYTITFHARNSPNPHGSTFDQWGYHYANDGTGGKSFQVRPHQNGFRMFPLVRKEVRPVSADEIVSSANFPEEMQQNFVLCNVIGYLGLKQYKLFREGYPKKKYGFGEVWGEPAPELLKSTDKNFRPTDLVFGEDGAMYVADWHNVIIGHMQHNVRDPNRDKKHGRIYRVVYKKRPLQKPVKIAGASLAELMENFRHPILGVRHRTRVELSGRETKSVIEAAKKFAATLDVRKESDAIPLLEVLWVHQQHNVRDEKLLKMLLDSPNQHVRIAAKTVEHFWGVADPTQGYQEVEEEKEVKVEKGGVVSRTDELVTVRVNAVVAALQFDFTEFEVKAGQKVKLMFHNPDHQQHNLLIVKPGTADVVAAAAIALGADGFKKKWLPESDDILLATDLLEHKGKDVLEFVAPQEAGIYPYVCTFPGHAGVMRGKMVVK